MDRKYKKMIQGMKEKEEPISLKEGWFLYILECNDGSLYTGITKDLARRFKMHSDGKASKYTRTRRPVKMIYQENCDSRTQALVRECAIKAFSRKKKDELIAAGLSE